jgi:hypothetical protein
MENRIVNTEKDRHFEVCICLCARNKKMMNPINAIVRVTTYVEKLITTGIVEKIKQINNEVWLFLSRWLKSRYMTQIRRIKDNEVRMMNAVFSSIPKRFVPSAIKM